MNHNLQLYDSATGDSLKAEKVVTLREGDDPLVLLYTTAKRGRIVQVQSGCLRIHYFYEEPAGQKMIEEDEWRDGVTLAQIYENAPAL